jgi:DnaJ-domain-containing protein 1
VATVVERDSFSTDQSPWRETEITRLEETALQFKFNMFRRWALRKSLSYRHKAFNDRGPATLLGGSQQLHTQFFLRREDEEDQRNRHPVAYYHTTLPSDSAVSITLGLGALSAVAYAGATAVKGYKEYVDSLPETPPEEEQKDSKAKKEQEQKGPRENVFSKWLGSDTKYYEGGFDDKMSPSEAARILGVRQSSSASRIKEAHRKLLMQNHPGKLAWRNDFYVVSFSVC